MGFSYEAYYMLCLTYDETQVLFKIISLEVKNLLNLKKLRKTELVELIKYYDEYIQDANDGELYLDGFKPVCVSEFYFNDLEAWKEDAD